MNRLPLILLLSACARIPPSDPAADPRLAWLAANAVVEEMGFTTFAIEANMPEAHRLGEYVQEMRGKTVQLSGWVKTSELVHGGANLWLRVDGPTHRLEHGALREGHGTTGWERQALELLVPEDAVGIAFGVTMSGQGKAWFDDLSVKADGVSWVDSDFDFDFEGVEPRGILPVPPNAWYPRPWYRVEYDATVAHEGNQSFLIASGPGASSASPEELATRTEALVQHIEGELGRYRAEVGAEAAEWALQEARIVQQWVGMGTANVTNRWTFRDAAMAENVLWHLTQDPDARIVVWAHNGHVAADEADGRWMGSHLREALGDDYLNVAFAASHGTYTAKKLRQGLGTYTLKDPPPDSFEAILEASGRERLLVDIRKAVPGDPGSGWLTESRPFGDIGAVPKPRRFQEKRIQGSYDLLFWIRSSTASRPLPRE